MKFKILTIFLILLSVIGLTLITACNDKEDKLLLNRKAYTSDIEIDLSQEISTDITYQMKPKVDIYGLVIAFEYLDKDNNILTTKIINLDDVKKKMEYKIFVNLIGFLPEELSNIKNTQIKIRAGTVMYFEKITNYQ